MPRATREHAAPLLLLEFPELPGTGINVDLALNGKVPESDWEAKSPSGNRLTTVMGVVN